MKRTIDSAQQLGLLVRARRKACGRRLDEVAAQAGLGHVFVRHVEHGKDSVHFGKLLQLLQELGVTLQVEMGEEEAAVFQRLEQKGLRPLKPRTRVEAGSAA